MAATSAALTRGDEQSLALLQYALVTPVHLVGEEHFAVIGRRPPALVQGQVGRGGLDEEEDLLSLQSQVWSSATMSGLVWLWANVVVANGANQDYQD